MLFLMVAAAILLPRPWPSYRYRLVVLLILLDALGNTRPVQDVLRNVLRRPSTTALVLGGLMVGTAIISASLVVGDTLDNMIVGEITKAYGDIDFAVTGQGSTAAASTRSVMCRRCARRCWISITWRGRSGCCRAPRASITGLEPHPGIGGGSCLTANAVSAFGGFTAEDGTAITTLPAEGEAYINKVLADRLGIEDGSQVLLARGQDHVITLTAVIVLDEKIAASGPSVFVDIATAQRLNGQDDVVNLLLISMDAQGREQAGNSREAVNSTLSRFPELDLGITRDRAQAIEDGRSRCPCSPPCSSCSGPSPSSPASPDHHHIHHAGEERKGEMGVARAVGMKREHLRKLFTYEGLKYAAVAAAIGTAVGLVLAYGLIIAAGAIISTVGSTSRYSRSPRYRCRSRTSPASC
jgi:putative ABC transport system permease protein